MEKPLANFCKRLFSYSCHRCYSYYIFYSVFAFHGFCFYSVTVSLVVFTSRLLGPAMMRKSPGSVTALPSPS